MYNYLQKIKNSEKNIFIIWHLFAFARMRIRSFILFYKQYTNYYDNILENIWQLMIQQFPNYLHYIKAYDELEIKANNWMEILKQLSIFQRENVHFEYYGIIHTREKMLMSLQEAENSGDNIIFPASFNPDTDVIVHSHHRLLYFHFATDGVLTSNECYTIFGKYYSNTQQTFYQLFEGLDIEIQKKLEQIIINPFLVDEMSLNQEEYLQENTQNLGYGQVMSTQKRHGLVQFILNGCNLIVKQGNY
uniref:Uncharacterized protein n=1 Tax=Meloidogyne enterolobii TaxID=390850 RepID=A0A6V7WV68_MELEN|nr:unnamed protein product [Meloidogyne enterolobii]